MYYIFIHVDTCFKKKQLIFIDVQCVRHCSVNFNFIKLLRDKL